MNSRKKITSRRLVAYNVSCAKILPKLVFRFKFLLFVAAVSTCGDYFHHDSDECSHYFEENCVGPATTPEPPRKCSLYENMPKQFIFNCTVKL